MVLGEEFWGNTKMVESRSNTFLKYSSSSSNLKHIQYLVGVAMRDNEYLRLHKNRERLLWKLRSENPNIKISFSSVERSQRKLWEKKLYIPSDPEDLKEWCRIRKLGYEEYKQFAMGDFYG